MRVVDRQAVGPFSNHTRRDVWRAAGLGALVGALPGRARAEASTSDRALILLMLVGGPSQLETWDPKPDAPAEIRGPFGRLGWPKRRPARSLHGEQI